MGILPYDLLHSLVGLEQLKEELLANVIATLQEYFDL